MILLVPSLVNYSVYALDKKMNNMIKLGYSIDEFRRICFLHPQVYILRFEKIKSKFEFFKELGIEKEVILKMTISQPLIYGLSIESIKQKIDNLLEIGYGFEDIIKITVKFPLLFCKNISDIKIKKRFYEQIGINDLIINNPRCLAQSMELSFARYMFYYRIGIKINRGNYMLLFMKQSEFLKKHGKTSKQLIDLYSYDEYLEKRKGLIKKR